MTRRRGKKVQWQTARSVLHFGLHGILDCLAIDCWCQQVAEPNLAHARQKAAMERLSTGRRPTDDEVTKLLRYEITFCENCGLVEDEVEIYEFSQPNNNITRFPTFLILICITFAIVA